jgi:hypothetical protein
MGKRDLPLVLLSVARRPGSANYFGQFIAVRLIARQATPDPAARCRMPRSSPRMAPEPEATDLGAQGNLLPGGGLQRLEDARASWSHFRPIR